MGERPREQALSNIRDALAALHQVPTAGLTGEKHADLTDAVETVGSLEAERLAGSVETAPVCTIINLGQPDWLDRGSHRL